MLQTINGFDLLLVIVIIGLVFKVMRLNEECNSYVGQIVRMSWELTELKERLYPSEPDLDKCVYCLDIEEKVTGNECFCAPF